ncbi:MAG: NAD(P)/FAD-dependent oxidoreductase [Desulfobacterales bacterium]
MEKHSDVLVIGGGIIGLACAYYLAKAGKNVRLLEQDAIGADTAASYGNCGLVFISHLAPLCAPGTIRHEMMRRLQGGSPLYIKLAPDVKRLKWFLNFARKCNTRHMDNAIKARGPILQNSIELLVKLFKEEHIECDWEEKGVLMVFKSRSEMLKYGQTNNLMKPYGLDAVSLVGDELFDLEPALGKEVYGAWFHKKDSHLRPDKLLSAWQQVLLKMGVVIEENCRLEKLVAESRQIRHAEATGGIYRAGEYVLATGAWTPQLTDPLKLSLPVEPGKGYSLTMARPAVCPAIPCYFSEPSVVATPWKSGFRLGGTMEFSGFNSDILARRVQNLITGANEYLKAPVGEPVMEEWVGMRPMVYDDLPIIDRAPNHPNLVVATGHGMQGISMATSTGKLVMEIITGRRPHIDPTAFGIRRFL